MEAPITEYFDDAPVITPAQMHTHPYQIPAGITTAICTFLSEHTDAALLQPILQDCKLLYSVYGRSGKIPLYQYRDQCLIVFMAVGAPNAAAVVEELKYLGIQNVIAYGTAGRLDASLPDDALVLIDRAIRDEGTSYHYLPASVYVATDPELNQVLAEFLATLGPVQRGTSWTTDALFRETNARMQRRMSQGAVVVDMECAAFAAACQRLGLRFSEFVFFSDDLTPRDGWQWLGDAAAGDVRRSYKVSLLHALIRLTAKIKLPNL